MAKLSKADQKFATEILGVTEEDYDAKYNFKRQNRFTGEEFDVCPVTAKAIDLVFRLEPLINSGNLPAIQRILPKVKSVGGAVQKFDRARYLVLKLNSSAYMGILD